VTVSPKHLQFKLIHMNSKKFQSQINQLSVKLSEDFPDMDFFKEGPAWKDTKTNIVWKNEDYYLKAFTPEWSVSWIKELELINLFNTFSEKTWALFSWPEIIKSNTNDDIYFLMKDIEKTWKTGIDFSSISQEELIKLYKSYREEFDEFEKFSKWKISTEKDPKIQKFVHSIKKIEEKIRSLEEKLWVLKLATKKLVGGKQLQHLQDWISKWDSVVKWIVEYDQSILFSKFQELQKKLKKYDFEYNFWRFRTWHVFSDWKSHQLIDFDNVWYQIKWTELLGIVRSNLFLPVEEYNSYAERKWSFENWYKQLLETIKNENLARSLVFQKLMGTIFMDFGYLMLKLENNRNKIAEKWLVPEENSKKWIEWNFKLLKDLFEI